MLLLIGIDIGTTNWKVVAYRPDGSAVRIYSTPAKLMTGIYAGCWDPEVLWEFTCMGIRTVTEECGSDTAGIAVSSTGEAGVLLDARGEAAYPIIPWYDQRTESMVDRWAPSAEAITRVTGFPPLHIASVNKILWIKENEPEAFARARRWLCLADYLAYRFSGEQVMDYTLACRTMLFDYASAEWSAPLIEQAGLDPDLLPPVAPSGTRIGLVKPSVARSLGLSSRTVVAAGGHDHLCGALAAGVSQGGPALDSIGTAETILVVHPPVGGSVNLYRTGLTVGRFTDGSSLATGGSLQTSGGVVDWAGRLLGYLDGGSLSEAYERMVLEATNASAAKSGLFFVPLLRGSAVPPTTDSAVEWVGLKESHSRGSLIRSVIEGLAFESKRILERVEATTGTDRRSIVVIGGGARNPLWLQVKADVLGTPLIVPHVEEAAACGAALLAAVGAGLFRSVPDAAEALEVDRVYVEPRTSMEDEYRMYRSILHDRCGIE